MVQYPSIEGPDGSLSAVVDFSINQIGIHKENSITFLNEESEVKIKNTATPIEIVLEVTNMHPFFSPFCVYASEIDEVNGVTKWSTDGCELKEVREAE